MCFPKMNQRTKIKSWWDLTHRSYRKEITIMSQECTNESCNTNNSNCNSSNDCCDLPERLIGLADEAWFEVVKDKLKKEIESSCGEKLDQLAKIVADANCAKWAHEVQGKVKCEEYKGAIKQLFVSCANEKP